MDVKVRVGQQYDYNEGSENLIPAMSGDNIYLDYAGMKRHGFAVDSFERSVGEACMRVKFIARYYTRTQIERAIASGGSKDSILGRIEKGYNAALSGGVVLVPEG